MRKLIHIVLFVAMANITMAQTPDSKKYSNAWEIGVGGSLFQFNRASFSNFTEKQEGYVFDLKMDHTVWGGNIYAANELYKHFYLDLQGTIGATKTKLNNKNETDWLYMVGTGLQWRFGEYMDSKYIDPFLRVGVNYMHKEFDVLYAGSEGPESDEMKWYLKNLNNSVGGDRHNSFPISLGMGLNMWMNDKWGVGLQSDYLLMPYKDVANSLQGTVRVMYRIGGSSKKTQPKIEYVDRIVEVERIIEKPMEATTTTITKEVEKLLLLENIYFEFDKADLKPESEEVLDKLAEILKQDISKRYLITGYTDARGKDEYNAILSKKRAVVVVKALIERGVPSTILKARGVGSKMSYAMSSEADNVRKGDRKITIELISNIDYWNILSNK